MKLAVLEKRARFVGSISFEVRFQEEDWSILWVLSAVFDFQTVSPLWLAHRRGFTPAKCNWRSTCIVSTIWLADPFESILMGIRLQMHAFTREGQIAGNHLGIICQRSIQHRDTQEMKIGIQFRASRYFGNYCTCLYLQVHRTIRAWNTERQIRACKYSAMQKYSFRMVQHSAEVNRHGPWKIHRARTKSSIGIFNRAFGPPYLVEGTRYSEQAVIALWRTANGIEIGRNRPMLQRETHYHYLYTRLSSSIPARIIPSYDRRKIFATDRTTTNHDSYMA